MEGTVRLVQTQFSTEPPGFFFFFFFVFLGTQPWYMEVPRLGGELELQPPASTTARAMPDPSPSETYTTARLDP